MKVTVFLMCHNEQVLIGKTIRHYRALFPACEIVVCDNQSTDGSVRVARDSGCRILSFATDGTLDEFVMLGIRNNVWKSVPDGWIVMCDMDEYLCIDDRQLAMENEQGTTVLTTRGFEIVGDSKSADLHDVDIADFARGYFSKWYSKKVCFRRDAVVEMSYGHGCHDCRPTGRVAFSLAEYPLYHMNCLGLPYLVEKHRQRYERSQAMRARGLAIHYTDDATELEKRFRSRAAQCQNVRSLASIYGSAISRSGVA